MKLLFDENLSFKLCERLESQYPGSSQVRLVGLAEADDRTVWNYARDKGFILVSLHTDFADKAALLGPPPKVIWLRRGNQPTDIIEKILRDHSVVIATFTNDAAACLEIY
jgi:predicted nuclease of predicted toxin-antitoxin system